MRVSTCCCLELRDALSDRQQQMEALPGNGAAMATCSAASEQVKAGTGTDLVVRLMADLKPNLTCATQDCYHKVFFLPNKTSGGLNIEKEKFQELPKSQDVNAENQTWFAPDTPVGVTLTFCAGSTRICCCRGFRMLLPVALGASACDSSWLMSTPVTVTLVTTFTCTIGIGCGDFRVSKICEV